MSDAANAMDFDALVMIPGTEYERIARMREQQRRKRKAELYSVSANRHKDRK